MPKLFTTKAKYIRANTNLMTRSIAFMTGGSLIFVLLADNVTPKREKEGTGLHIGLS